MEGYIKKYGRNSLIISILLLVFSIFLIFRPVQSLSFLMISFGVITAITGIIHIVSYFKSPDELKMFNFELIQGIAGILLGVILACNSNFLGLFLPFIIGVWVITSSLVRLQLAFNLRSVPNSNWIWLLVLSIITMILGIIIFMNPITSTIAITTLGGILLLISELINILEYGFILVKIDKITK